MALLNMLISAALAGEEAFRVPAVRVGRRHRLRAMVARRDKVDDYPECRNERIRRELLAGRRRLQD